MGTLDVAQERNTLKLEGTLKNREQLMADVSTEGVAANAVLLRSFSAGLTGEIGITETVRSLRDTIAEVKRGDLSSAEAMLTAQAAALNAMFGELARRSALNMGEYMDAADRYMRLALKAQGQCRATLETLAVIKSPPVVFARQANINNGGQQQVNNGGGHPNAADSALVRPSARAASSGTAPSELLGADRTGDHEALKR